MVTVQRDHLLMPKVSGPTAVTYLNQTPRLQRCMVGCDSKNGYPKKLYFKEIALRAQYLVIILSSILNIIVRGSYTIIERERDVHICAIFYEDNGYMLDMDLLITSH